MAARKRLREEATCPVCLDFFARPVTLGCGHSFCQGCLDRCWEKSAKASSSGCCRCPQCRERAEPRGLKPSWQLAKLVEVVAKELGQEEEAAAAGWWGVCQGHWEPLKLFCLAEQAPLCLVCQQAKSHRGHPTIPLEEAVQEHQDQLSSCFEYLRKRGEKMLAHKADTEKESQNLFDEIERQGKKAVAEFRQLHLFLEEQEKLLLLQMEEVKVEIGRKRDEHLARIEDEIEASSSVDRIRKEMEEKCQHSGSEFLEAARSFLKRCEKNIKARQPMAFPPELKWKIWNFCDITPFLGGVIRQFKDSLLSGLQLQKANVTLDPDTAHPQLILSVDRKSASGGEKRQELPDNPERFDLSTLVLGREGFTTGRHSWEVTVGREGEWSLGVARRTVKRKGAMRFGSEEGIWDLGKSGCVYFAGDGTPVSLRGELRRIRVGLNCNGGRLAFYDVDTADLLFAYSAAWCSGETLLPCFWLGRKARLTLSFQGSQSTGREGGEGRGEMWQHL